MRVLFVTPEYHVPRLQHVLRDYADVEAFFLVYATDEEVPERFRELQSQVDGVIFAGQRIYRYAEQHLHPEAPWIYLPNETSSILRTLLLIQKKKLDITRICFDTFPKAAIEEVYLSELGMKRDELHLQCFDGDSYAQDYTEQVIYFHKRLVAQKKTCSCAITRIYQVHKALQKEGIPHEYACHTHSTIRQQLDTLLQLYRMRQLRSGQFAVLHIAIAFPSDFSFFLPSNYQFAQLRMKVAGSIYRFSDLIQGIVVENSAARYTIVATKPVIEQVTSSFKVLPLIEWIKKDTMYSVNIGIGMGETLSVAYHNASRAQLRTKGQEGDNIILVYADGMMSSISVESAEQTEGSYEDRLRQIAKDCEVPFAMVSKLYRFAEGWPYKQFSATDVSKELGIAKRTTDRFLAKLEAAGYITVTARPLTGERGRPSRMMQVSYKKLR